jgi:polysaccharide export outer membrane protein
MIDPVLEPSDRVVVGVSGSSQAWQDLLQALPAFALFTRL